MTPINHSYIKDVDVPPLSPLTALVFVNKAENDACQLVS